MSYVAVSSKFMDDVKGKLRQMRHREVITVASLDYKASGTRSDLLQWAWGEHLPLKEVIPAKWCGKVERVTFSYDAGDRGKHRILCDIVPPLITPPGGAPSGVFSIAPDDPEIKEFVDREAALYDITQRWDKVDKQITDFLKTCKSVNEALKLWPQIDMYIPASYIERAQEKKERVAGGPSNAEKALKELDTDHLTTAAVISRMSGQG